MPGFWSRLQDVVWWHYGAQGPPLRDSERIVLNGVASLLGFIPFQERVVLTNKRLLHMPLILRPMPSWPLKREWKEIPLEAIIGIGRGSRLRGLWGGFPGFPVFTIETTSRTFKFQTMSAGLMLREIERLMPPSRT